jgi:RNA polymerase sigma-70 factor (ECF subfamily)
MPTCIAVTDGPRHPSRRQEEWERPEPTERAVFLLREVFELDFDEIAASVGKSEANTRQVLTRARRRLRESRPRFTMSR